MTCKIDANIICEHPIACIFYDFCLFFLPVNEYSYFIELLVKSLFIFSNVNMHA